VNPPSGWEFDPPFLPDNVDGKRSPVSVLELGSGVGLLGFHLARVLEEEKDLAVLTDLPDVRVLAAFPRSMIDISTGMHLAKRKFAAIRLESRLHIRVSPKLGKL
jgi:hypothetical protein